jgi:hypothetical protein
LSRAAVSLRTLGSGAEADTEAADMAVAGRMRDMFLLEGGCCLAELLGCGSQLVLVAASLGPARDPEYVRSHRVDLQRRRTPTGRP